MWWTGKACDGHVQRAAKDDDVAVLLSDSDPGLGVLDGRLPLDITLTQDPLAWLLHALILRVFGSYLYSDVCAFSRYADAYYRAAVDYEDTRSRRLDLLSFCHRTPGQVRPEELAQTCANQGFRNLGRLWQSGRRLEGLFISIFSPHIGERVGVALSLLIIVPSF